MLVLSLLFSCLMDFRSGTSWEECEHKQRQQRQDNEEVAAVLFKYFYERRKLSFRFLASIGARAANIGNCCCRLQSCTFHAALSQFPAAAAAEAAEAAVVVAHLRNTTNTNQDGVETKLHNGVYGGCTLRDETTSVLISWYMNRTFPCILQRP